MDTLVCIISFWLIGYQLSINAHGGIMGSAIVSNIEGTENYYISWLIAFSFCNTSSTIVSGCIAERMHNSTYLMYSFLMVTLIYPLPCAWVWGGGWLSKMGFLDYAGSGVVHLIGGVAGLVHTLSLGPRLGFSKDYDKQKFVYGRNTITKELLKLEMMDFDL